MLRTARAHVFRKQCFVWSNERMNEGTKDRNRRDMRNDYLLIILFISPPTLDQLARTLDLHHMPYATQRHQPKCFSRSLSSAEAWRWLDKSDLAKLRICVAVLACVLARFLYLRSARAIS